MSDIFKAACRLQNTIINGTCGDIAGARSRAEAMLRVAAHDRDWDGAGAAQQVLDMLDAQPAGSEVK